MTRCLLFSDQGYPLAVPIYAKTAGPYRVATELRNHGFPTQVVDFATSWSGDRLKEVIAKFVTKDTLFVGFSSTFFKNTKDLPWANNEEVVGWIHARNPNTKIVLGGGKATNLSSDLVDYYISGYADHSVVALAKHLAHGDPIKFHDFMGRKYIDSQRDYPVNAFHHAIRYEDNDIMDAHMPVALEVARGCIFRCAYCAFPLNGKRRDEYVRTYQEIGDELTRNYELYGLNSYFMSDDTYNDAVDKVEGMANMFARLPFKVSFTCYARLDVLYAHQEMATMMQESGCKSVSFGVETLHHDAGKVIGKGMHPDKTVEALQWVRGVWGDNVLTKIGLIAGLPKEPIQSIVQTQQRLMNGEIPAHSWKWVPLAVRKPTKRSILNPWQSPFALHPEKYGITHPGEDPTYWEHEHMNRKTAETIADKFYSQAQVKGWVSGIEYLQYKNVLAPDADLWKARWREVESPEYALRVRSNVERYKERLLAL